MKSTLSKPCKMRHVFFAAALMLVFTPIAGHSQSIFEEPNEQENTLEEYNKEKQDIEVAIKKKECKTDRAEAKQRFISELQTLDSLIASSTLNKIPDQCKDNKMIIVSKWKEGSTCVKIRYESRKYLAGCPVPFFADSVSWSNFENLNKAIAEEKLCVKELQFSNYTQVDKIPEADYTDESALILLHQIERFLAVYGAQVGATYSDYVAYEVSKNISDTRQAVQMRTAFLNKCMSKIKQ